MRNKFIICIVALLMTSFLMAQSQENTIPPKVDPFNEVDSLIAIRQPNKAKEILFEVMDEAEKKNDYKNIVLSFSYFKSLLRPMEVEDRAALYFTLLKRVEGYQEPIKSLSELTLVQEFVSNFYSWFGYQRLSFYDSLDFSEEINKFHFVYNRMKGLENQLDALKKFDIQPFEGVLLTAKDSLRQFASLSDYLGYSLIHLYQSNLIQYQGGLKHAATASTEWYSTSNKFVLLDFEEDNLTTSILKLFQSIEKNNLNRPDYLSVAAYQRLHFLKTQFHSVEIDSTWEEHYEYFKASSARSKFLFEMAKADFDKGTQYHHKTNSEVEHLIKKAHSMLNAELEEHPNNDFKAEIIGLIQWIEAKTISFTVPDAMVSKKKIPLLMKHKNHSDYVVRIYRVKDYDPLKHKGLKDYALAGQLELIQTENLKLKNKDLFQTRSLELFLEPIAEEGHYFLVASDHGKDLVMHADDLLMYANDHKKWEDLKLSTSSFTITNIAVSTSLNNNVFTLLVVDQSTGKPISGAKVSLHYRDYRKGNDYQTYDRGTTDKNGFFTTKIGDNESRSLKYVIEDKNSIIDGTAYVYQTGEPQTYSQIKLFTDRSIYRPGQTVYFKGIANKGKENEFNILKNEKVIIRIRDVNYQEVYREEFTTNEWGSIDGNYTLPSGLALGNFTLQASFASNASGNQTGTTNFSVEEYKRPTFEVKLNLPKEEAKLNDTVSITGDASAFAGYPIANAEVTYTVYRSWNRYWRYFYSSSASQDLLREGKLWTDSNGEFTIDFFAETDPNAMRNAYYSYEVRVKVTDLSGETHEKSISLQLNEVGLSLQAELPSRMFTHEDPSFTVKVVNLSGKEQEGYTGKIEVFKKVTQEHFLNRIWENPESSQWEEKEFNKIFPNMRWDSYATYPTEEKVKEMNFVVGQELKIQELIGKNQGDYVFRFSTLTKTGDTLRVEQSLEVIDVNAKELPVHESIWSFVSKNNVEVGETIDFQVGSSFKNAEALVSVYRNGKLLSQEWVKLNDRHSMCYVIDEKDRGILSYHAILFYEGVFYSTSQTVNVPFSNKKLDIITSTFRDQLLPGQEEQWSFTLKDNAKNLVKGELAAAMYDASLDKFRGHGWSYTLYGGRETYLNWSREWSRTLTFSGNDNNDWRWRQTLDGRLNKYKRGGHGFDYYLYNMNTFGEDGEVRVIQYKMPIIMKDGGASGASRSVEATVAVAEAEIEVGGIAANFDDVSGGIDTDLEQQQTAGFSGSTEEVVPRSNFNETAFFYPTIYANSEDEYVLNFTLPESLTRWKLLMLAHTKDMRIGTLQQEIEAKKELMITANAPRFVRQGDVFYFSAKVVNLTEETQTVEASLLLEDPILQNELSLVEGDLRKMLTVEANSSQDVTWKVKVGQQELIQYTISVANANFSDGERNLLPVLSNRVLITETDHVLIKKAGTVSHTFENFATTTSPTLEHKSFTVEYMDNLAWQAVMALPYMMKENNQSLTSLANKYYANELSRHIVGQFPQIQEIFNQWKMKTPDALWSELEKNEELKTILLEETPWVMEAKNEAEQRRRIAVLFEVNQLQDNQGNLLNELKNNQNADGGFSWFKGGKSNVYITQNILTRFGHLERLGINTSQNQEMIRKAESFIANAQVAYYNKYIKDKKLKENYRLSTTDINWLYTRTLFSSTTSKEIDEVTAFYASRLKETWTNYTPYVQSLIGIYFKKSSFDKEANLIYASLLDRGMKNTKLGMYWVENSGFFWYQNKISTQAMIISFFQEMNASEAVMDDARLWLILNKESSAWETSGETAEAIYAILLSGRDYLKSAPRPTIKVGNTELVYESTNEKNKIAVEWTPGLGQVKHQWNGAEVHSNLGSITIEKHSDAPAVLNLYWQYTEDLSQLKASDNYSMQISKRYKKLVPGEKGEVGVETSTFAVGDKIEVELIVTVDRDLEFVHIKDLRPAGFEPTLNLSGYHWDKLTYYQSPKDVSMDYFIEYMPKGTYKFSYIVYATHSGNFNSGLATVQSFYAPKFSGHTGTIEVEVKR